MTMACANELFQVKLSPEEKRNKRSFNGAKKSESLDFVVDITAYMAVSQQESSSSKLYQSGTIPSPRTGHSLTMITNELAVLFGGITLDNREHGVEHVSTDMQRWVFLFVEHEWIHLVMFKWNDHCLMQESQNTWQHPASITALVGMSKHTVH